MTWTLDLGANGHRAYVTPMDGTSGPYRLSVVTSDDVEAARFVGVASVGKAVESAITFLESKGERIPMGVRQAWESAARSVELASSRPGQAR